MELPVCFGTVFPHSFLCAFSDGLNGTTRSPRMRTLDLYGKITILEITTTLITTLMWC
jgi:hypothetical protein